MRPPSASSQPHPAVPLAHAVFDTVRYALRCGPRGNRACARGTAGWGCEDAEGGRMRGRRMKRLVQFVCAGAILLFAGVSWAGQWTSVKDAGEHTARSAAVV